MIISIINIIKKEQKHGREEKGEEEEKEKNKNKNKRTRLSRRKKK